MLKKDLPACPVATTVGMIGNNWKLLIMRDVMYLPVQNDLGNYGKVLKESARKS